MATQYQPVRNDRPIIKSLWSWSFSSLPLSSIKCTRFRYEATRNTPLTVLHYEGRVAGKQRTVTASCTPRVGLVMYIEQTFAKGRRNLTRLLLHFRNDSTILHHNSHRCRPVDWSTSCAHGRPILVPPLRGVPRKSSRCTRMPLEFCEASGWALPAVGGQRRHMEHQRPSKVVQLCSYGVANFRLCIDLFRVLGREVALGTD